MTRINKIVFRDTEQPYHVYMHKVHLTGKGWIWNAPAPPAINILDLTTRLNQHQKQVTERASEEATVVEGFAQERLAVAEEHLGPVAQEYVKHCDRTAEQSSLDMKMATYKQYVAVKEDVAVARFKKAWQANKPEDATSPACWLYYAQAKHARQILEAVSGVAARFRTIERGVAKQEGEETTRARLTTWLADATNAAAEEKVAADEMLETALAGRNADDSRVKVLEWIGTGMLPEPTTAD